VSEPLNTWDFERLAEGKVEAGPWGYFAGGAGDERTLAVETKEIERSHVQPPSTSAMVTGRRSASDVNVAAIMAVTMTPSRPPASGITSSATQSTK